MTVHEFDLVVIGTGPGGEGAAMKAAKGGNRVAVVEMQPQVGGNCTHKGTIPSKALRHAVSQIIHFNTDSMFRDIGEPRWLSFPRLLRTANNVISHQVRMRTDFYARNRIQVFFGKARFVDPHTLEIQSRSGGVETVQTRNVVIATGSRPYHPDDIDFRHPRIFDSDTILEAAHTPRKLIIYGAGVIGCEYASIFCGLGVKVDLINTRERLLEFLDNEITDALSYHLRKNGVLIRHSEQYDKVTADEQSVTLHLKSGKTLKADTLLWCNGRTGNTDDMGLENVGLEPDGRGQLKVNERYRSQTENIYVVGDVIGPPSLASAAYDQGRAAAAAILKDDATIQYVVDVPSGIYTIPEISSVGKNEAELTAEKIPYEIGHASFKHTARGQIAGETVGMLKLLFHRDTLELLGIHCFGDRAAEIVHIGQAIMHQSGAANTIEYFAQTTFNYPTMAEMYRVAALNGLNRVHDT